MSNIGLRLMHLGPAKLSFDIKAEARKFPQNVHPFFNSCPDHLTLK